MPPGGLLLGGWALAPDGWGLLLGGWGRGVRAWPGRDAPPAGRGPRSPWLAAGRPRWRSFSGAQWRLVLLLAAVYATMNLSLYSAIARLGLGLAVTLEFLGRSPSRWPRRADGRTWRAR